MDGRPLNISTTELNAFRGNNGKCNWKNEIITQPGAEFPATSGGAILNIITNKNTKIIWVLRIQIVLVFTNYDDLRMR
jgi:hypothetical protein